VVGLLAHFVAFRAQTLHTTLSQLSRTYFEITTTGIGQICTDGGASIYESLRLDSRNLDEATIIPAALFKVLVTRLVQCLT